MNLFDMHEDLILYVLKTYVNLPDMTKLSSAISEKEKRLYFFQMIDCDRFSMANNCLSFYLVLNYQKKIFCSALKWIAANNIKIIHLVLIKDFFIQDIFSYRSLNFTFVEEIRLKFEDYDPSHHFWSHCFNNCFRLNSFPVSITAVFSVSAMSSQIGKNITTLHLPYMPYNYSGKLVESNIALIMATKCPNIVDLDLGHYFCTADAAKILTKNKQRLHTLCWGKLKNETDSTVIDHVVINCPHLINLLVLGNYLANQFETIVSKLKQLEYFTINFTKLDNDDNPASLYHNYKIYFKVVCQRHQLESLGLYSEWIGSISVDFVKELEIKQNNHLHAMVKAIGTKLEVVCIDLDAFTTARLAFFFLHAPTVKIHLFHHRKAVNFSHVILRIIFARCQKYSNRIHIVGDFVLSREFCQGSVGDSLKELSFENNSKITTEMVIMLLSNNLGIIKFDAVGCDFVNCDKVYLFMKHRYYRVLEIDSIPMSKKNV